MNGGQWANFYFIPFDLFTIFLIYIIWKHSPDKMQSYKYFVMKMTLTDLIFSFVVGHLFQPVLLFPLPAATAIGLLQYAGPVGGRIAVISNIFQLKPVNLVFSRPLRRLVYPLLG